MYTNPRTRAPRKAFTHVLAVAMIGGSLLVGLLPAGVGAAPSTSRTHTPPLEESTLTIYPSGSGWCVLATATFAMADQDARALLGGGARVDARLWGDDPSYLDDVLLGPHRADATRTSPSPTLLLDDNDAVDGLAVEWRVCGVSSGTLDEDRDDRDELHVALGLYDARGRFVDVVETPRFTGTF